MFDFSIVTNWFDTLLRSAMPSWAAILIECVVVGLIIITLYACFAIFLIYFERKICAFFQCRLGPNRVGKWGLLQVFADVFKMLTKEIIFMKNTDRLIYVIAPVMVILSSMLTFSCIPWNKGAEILDFNVGVFFFLAASSLGIVGILLAGIGSQNKYSLIGAMRAGAQIISYELSIGMTMLAMIALTGTMQFSAIVEGQADCWNIVKGHVPAIIAFIIYMIAGNAECNRGPFDMPEPTNMHALICACIATTIFLGGWMPLHIGVAGFDGVMDAIPGFVWFVVKAVFVTFLLMWERWTFPRLRIDQLLNLEWKYLIPISMGNLVLMALISEFGLHF